MTQYVLIVAGGKGIRMGGDIPKQFLPIGGVPVLMRTMDAFYAYNQDIQIILVLPHDQQAFWQDCVGSIILNVLIGLQMVAKLVFILLKTVWRW